MFIAQSSQKSKRNYNLQCDYCHLKGHTKDQCYKLMKYDFCNKPGHVREACYKIVGYPSDFKGKRRANVVQMKGGGPHFPQHDASGMTCAHGSTWQGNSSGISSPMFTQEQYT